MVNVVCADDGSGACTCEDSEINTNLQVPCDGDSSGGADFLTGTEFSKMGKESCRDLCNKWNSVVTNQQHKCEFFKYQVIQ